MSLPSLEWVNQDSAYLRQQRAGFAWLRFVEPMEAAFRRYHAEANLRRMRGAVLVSCLMWLLFTWLDYRSMPVEFRDHSLAFRLPLLPLVLLTYWATFKAAWHARLQLMAGICALTSGFSVVGVIWLARAHEFALPYEGIILTTVFCYFLLGLRFSTASLCGWLTFAAYLGAELSNDLDAQLLIYNGFFYSRLISSARLAVIFSNTRPVKPLLPKVCWRTLPSAIFLPVCSIVAPLASKPAAVGDMPCGLSSQWRC